jgi:hypothetical protein
VLLIIDLELGSRILAKDNNVPGADLDVLMGTHRDDLCGLRLLLGRIWKNYARRRLLLRLDHLHQCTIP